MFRIAISLAGYCYNLPIESAEVGNLASRNTQYLTNGPRRPRENAMEEGSKRRLIGATVVVVLLVIFVPMVLEEDPKPPATSPVPDVVPKDQARPEMDAEFRQPAKQSPLATITELPPPTF